MFNVSSIVWQKGDTVLHLAASHCNLMAAQLVLDCLKRKNDTQEVERFVNVQNLVRFQSAFNFACL